MARRHDSVKTTRRRPAAVFCFCSPARARRKPELMRNQHYSTPARNFILMAMPRVRRPAKKNCFCAPDRRRVAIAHNAAQLAARNCRRMRTTPPPPEKICTPPPDAIADHESARRCNWRGEYATTGTDVRKLHTEPPKTRQKYVARVFCADILRARPPKTRAWETARRTHGRPKRAGGCVYESLVARQKNTIFCARPPTSDQSAQRCTADRAKLPTDAHNGKSCAANLPARARCSTQQRVHCPTPQNLPTVPDAAKHTLRNTVRFDPRPPARKTCTRPPTTNTAPDAPKKYA